ncbi:aspartate/glutamate racemase family protein [Actinopolymorpha alba]|uniref:aspartate/glutamate racemase family protein n=1 Tax=Actinopolymorpha alba TaxID=533267 RepID=UPI0003A18812|nr:aspartate/glutamate racemase family protein [Actinopolymorpha alba]
MSERIVRPPFVGIIRVVSSSDRRFVETHGKWIEERYALRTLSRCIPDQPHGVYDEESEARAVPKIVGVASGLVADGAGCLLISCAADPALAEVRAAVKVPVVGAGSAGAATALALGGKVGVLGITADAPAAVREVLGERFVTAARPDGVRRTTDLLEPGADDRAVKAAWTLVDAGADVVLFACTGFTTIGLGARIRSELGVPVVDAVLAAGLVASYALGRDAHPTTVTKGTTTP